MFILCVVYFVNNQIFWSPSSATTLAEDNGRLFPDAQEDFVQVTKEKYTMITKAAVKDKLTANAAQSSNEPLTSEMPPEVLPTSQSALTQPRDCHREKASSPATPTVHANEWGKNYVRKQ